MRITELEQFDLAATKRMDDVSTAEQRQIKAKAQKAGRETGKSEKELQQRASGRLRLSLELRSALQAARETGIAIGSSVEIPYPRFHLH